MSSRILILSLAIGLTAAGCTSSPLRGIPFGEGVYGFTAPEGVEPRVVAGYVWWKFSAEGTVPWRGLFWLEPPESESLSNLAAETAAPGEPPSLSLDTLAEISGRFYPEKGAEPGIFALLPDRSVGRVAISETQALMILNTIHEERHIPLDSPVAEVFRDQVAPHLKSFRTPLTWQHVRKPEQESTWVAPDS